MILRTWSARATSSGAAEYRDYFAGALLPELRDLPGFAGGYLLCRETDGAVELTTHTFWESTEVIHAFAGEDISQSTVSPRARAMLLDIDPTATHHTVLVDGRHG